MDKKRRISEHVIEKYSNGSSVSELACEWSVTNDDILLILREYKELCTINKTFTTEFKELIANRDSYSGVTRTSIAKELGINPNTVKKACTTYGNAFKEKAQSHQEFTRINGSFSTDNCVSCNSKKVNKVDDETYYCMDCGEEHIFKKVYTETKDGEEPKLIEEYILKVNYEWLD